MTEINIFKELLNYGGLGILLVFLIVFARELLKREQLRADNQYSEVQRLNTLMADKVIPALISATNAIAASQALLQAIQYKLDIEAEFRKKVINDKA